MKEEKKVLQLGDELLIYVKEFEQNVKYLREASFFDRNPYVRSAKAKANLKAVKDSAAQCVDALLHYVAALAKYHLCDRQQLNAYFFVYQFLFSFQEDIKGKEMEHALLIRDMALSLQIDRFISYTEHFVEQCREVIQKQGIDDTIVYIPYDKVRKQDMVVWAFLDRITNHHTGAPECYIVKKEYHRYFTVIAYLYEHLHDDHFYVAIDGRCGSGKTTMANVLQEVFSCPLFHMDDYFLKQEAKSKQRLKEPGGNVDYERFYQEVWCSIKEKRDITYRPFDCHSQSYGEKKTIPYQPLILVEGSYAQHPYFDSLIDGRIFVTCDEDTQKRRLQRRNPKLYERFVNEWIPLEETYFAYYHIEEKSNLVFHSSEHKI